MKRLRFETIALIVVAVNLLQQLGMGLLQQSYKIAKSALTPE